MTLINQTTGSTAGPFSVTIKAPAQLTKPAPDVIRQWLTDTSAYFRTQSASTPEDAASLQKAIDAFAQARTEFDKIVASGLTPALSQALTSIAQTIANSSIYRDAGWYDGNGHGSRRIR